MAFVQKNGISLTTSELSQSLPQQQQKIIMNQNNKFKLE